MTGLATNWEDGTRASVTLFILENPTKKPRWVIVLSKRNHCPDSSVG